MISCNDQIKIEPDVILARVKAGFDLVRPQGYNAPIPHSMYEPAPSPF